jgi:hypothetical protein
MVMIESNNSSLGEYIEQMAVDNLTDEQFELEFQGLFVSDKVRYLAAHGINLIPIATLNGITI